MKLFLVRHGDTVTSGKTYAGRTDVALSETGRIQATTLADQLIHEPISMIITSPLARAVETAQPLARALDLNLIEEPNLMEFDFGDYEGRSKAELGLKLRKVHAQVPVPGGESLQDAWTRAGHVVQRLNHLVGQHDRICVLVGHFWINRLVWGHLSGLDFESACRSKEYRPKTGSLLRLNL